MKLSEILIRHHVDETATILHQLERLDESLIDETSVALAEGVPWENYEPTLRGLLRCIVATEAIWLAAFEGATFPEIETRPTISELIKIHESTGNRLVKLVEDIEAQNLWGTEFVDALCSEPVRFEFGAVMAHIIVFSAHRRQLALAAMRSLGVMPLDYGDPINWLRTVKGETVSKPTC